MWSIMKGRLFGAAVVLSVLCFLSTARVFTDPVPIEASAQTGPATVTNLPASLDGLYPPKAPRPVLLFAMHDLNAALTGIVVDVTQNDRDGALANLKSFEERYREVALLVPEWEPLYPAEPVQELGEVVPGGNPEEVMAAVAKVGAVCHDCHVANMVPTQLRYHWPNFGTVTVQDPVTNAELDYAPFMQMLNASLTGVAIDVEQGQPENARAQLAALRSRMAALKESCENCHDSERSYFVDERIESLLADMGRALDAPAPDPSAVAALNRRIGEESCFRCHLVHLPAAYARSAPH